MLAELRPWHSSNCSPIVLRRAGALKRACKHSVSRSSRLRCNAISNRLQVVFVTTEVAPWSKSGGLADVLSGLPAALAARGHRVMTVSPRYSNYSDTLDSGARAPVCLGPQPCAPPASQPGSTSSALHACIGPHPEPAAPPASKPNHPSHLPQSVNQPQSVKYFVSDLGDGVQYVFVDHPIFQDTQSGCDAVYSHTHIPPVAVAGHAAGSMLPAHTPDTPYCIGPASARERMQTRNSVLCQAALAAPVLLWPDFQQAGLSQEDQMELTRLQEQLLAGEPLHGAGRSSGIDIGAAQPQAWCMSNGVARPARSRSQSPPCQSSNLTERLNRLRSATHTLGGTLQHGFEPVGDATGTSCLPPRPQSPGAVHSTASVASVNYTDSTGSRSSCDGSASGQPLGEQAPVTAAGVVGNTSQPAEIPTSDAPGLAGQDMSMPGRSTDSAMVVAPRASADNVIFVGNDWPSGLLALWLHAMLDLLDTSQGRQRLRERVQAAQQQAATPEGAATAAAQLLIQQEQRQATPGGEDSVPADTGPPDGSIKVCKAALSAELMTSGHSSQASPVASPVQVLGAPAGSKEVAVPVESAGDMQPETAAAQGIGNISQPCDMVHHTVATQQPVMQQGQPAGHTDSNGLRTEASPADSRPAQDACSKWKESNLCLSAAQLDIVRRIAAGTGSAAARRAGRARIGMSGPQLADAALDDENVAGVGSACTQQACVATGSGLDGMGSGEATDTCKAAAEQTSMLAEASAAVAPEQRTPSSISRHGTAQASVLFPSGTVAAIAAQLTTCTDEIKAMPASSSCEEPTATCSSTMPAFVDLPVDAVREGFQASLRPDTTGHRPSPRIAWRSSPSNVAPPSHALPTAAQGGAAILPSESQTISAAPATPSPHLPSPTPVAASQVDSCGALSSSGTVQSAAAQLTPPPPPPVNKQAAATLSEQAETPLPSPQVASGLSQRGAKAQATGSSGQAEQPQQVQPGEAQPQQVQPGEAQPQQVQPGEAQPREPNTWGVQQRLQQVWAAGQQQQAAARGAARRLVAFQRLVARRLQGAKFVHTIHNAAYQGVFSAASFPSLGLPAFAAEALLTHAPPAPNPAEAPATPATQTPDQAQATAQPSTPTLSAASGSLNAKECTSEQPTVGDGAGSGSAADVSAAESQGLISWLQAAVITSDLVLTVSPQYARELLDQANQALDQQLKQPPAQPQQLPPTAASQGAGQLQQAVEQPIQAVQQLGEEGATQLGQATDGQSSPTPAQPRESAAKDLTVEAQYTNELCIGDRQRERDGPSAPTPVANITHGAAAPSPSAATVPAVLASTGASVGVHTQRMFAALRNQGVVGIMNGIDTNAWNPRTDTLLPRALRYGSEDVHVKKAKAKGLLQRRLGLIVNPSAPLVAFIGRLEEQKGADVLLAALPSLLGPPSPAVIDPRKGTRASTSTANQPATKHQPAASQTSSTKRDTLQRPHVDQHKAATASPEYKSHSPAIKQDVARAAQGSSATGSTPSGQAGDPAAVNAAQQSAKSLSHSSPTLDHMPQDHVSQHHVPEDHVPQDHMPQDHVQVVMLGAGHRWQEQCLSQLSVAWPGRAHGQPCFSEPLAHLIMAAADYLVVPSRYEPCGLVALCALRYGTLPLVSPAGGLPEAATGSPQAIEGPGCDQPPCEAGLQKAAGHLTLPAINPCNHAKSCTTRDSPSQPLATFQDHSSAAHQSSSTQNGSIDGNDGGGGLAECVSSQRAIDDLGYVLPCAIGAADDPVAFRQAVTELLHLLTSVLDDYDSPAFLARRVRCMGKGVSWDGPAAAWEQALQALLQTADGP